MVIVTGANGFIGSAVVWQLNQRGIPVIAAVVDTVSIEKRSDLLVDKKFSQFLLKDELWDFLNLPSSIQKISWIIHMGANSSTTETNTEHLWENNTLYTQRIFDWCARYQKNLIYASSAATYGSGELGFDDFIDSEQLRPLNHYGESKVKFDRWAVKQSKTPLSWYGLKFFNVYGPNEHHKGPMASLVYKAFQQIKETGTLKLFKSYLPAYKDGEQLRDFIYVKDVVSWIAELMMKKPPSGIYNMGYGESRTWNSLAQATFSSCMQPPRIQYIEMPENIRKQYQYYTKANMQTWFAHGLSSPQWSLENGVKDYIQNYLQKNQVL